MEKTCGYLDRHKKFWKTKAECEEANKRIEISKLKEALENIEYSFRNKLYEDCRDSFPTNVDYAEVANYVLSRATVILLRDTAVFEDFLKRKKELKDDLDTLRATYDTHNYLKAPWYLKYLWWK